MILAGCWVQNRLFGVFQRQQTRELSLCIGHQQFFDTAFFHQADRLVTICRFSQNGEVFRRHHHADGRGIVRGEPHITICHDAHHPALIVDHRKSGDIVSLLQGLCIGKRLVGAQGNRVVDDPAFKPFDPADFAGLLFDAEVAVHNPHAAGLRHGDGHSSFGDCVHGRRQKRDVQPNLSGHECAGVRGAGQHGRRLRHKQHIIKRKGLANLHLGYSMDVSFGRDPIAWIAEQGKASYDMWCNRPPSQNFRRKFAPWPGSCAVCEHYYDDFAMVSPGDLIRLRHNSMPEGP